MDYNLFKGWVTHIIDPNNFWMRLGTDSDMHHFSKYQQWLDDFYNAEISKYTCDPDQMHAGYLVVVAKTVQDDRWHWERAQVTRVDSDNKIADVFFVDLGFTYIVELDSCRAITFDVFNFLPPQASRVSLGGVKPLSSSWTTRATSLLHKDTQGKEVLTLLMHYDETSMCYTVIIYTRQSDGTWRSLIHKMQEEELAVSTDDVIQEVLTDVIVDQCLLRMEERQKQDREAETNGDGGDDKRTSVEEEEVEKWEDDCVGGDSDDFLADLMKSSQNTSVERKGQSSSPPDKQREVTCFDYRTLMQTRSISLTQMQREKGMETQEATKTNIERDLQRLESCQSHNDEQDWDTVQDTDFHVDIVSQIYQAVPDRQYSSDDGMSELWDAINVHELAASPKKRPTATSREPSSYPLVMDIVKRHHHLMKEEEDGHGQDDNEMSSSSNVGDGGGGRLSEIDSYRLEKQIKDILINPEGMESDVVCASIYGVVEPDVDALMDHLRVVICAILEHIMKDCSQHSDIAFAILETYSDANEFGTAMIEVVNDLKERFVKKHRGVRLSNIHKDFAQVLALLFKQAEDWEEGVCKAVQDLAMASTERWVIFNKQRHLSGDELVQSELVFLESAQTFLLECHDVLSINYSSNLSEIMKNIRDKLLEDKTTRSVRTILLDILLAFNSDGRLDKCATCSVGTQTEYMEGSNSKFTWTTDVDSGGDNVSTKRIVTKPHSYTVPSFPGFTQTNSFPYLTSNVRNLPPRMLKKYVQEHVLTEPQLPLSPSGKYVDDTVTNQVDEVSPDFDANIASPHSVSKHFYSQVVDRQNAYDYGKELSGKTNYENESCTSEQNRNLRQKFVMEEISPSTIRVMQNKPSSPKTIVEKMSPSPKTIMEKMSPSPKTIMEKMSPSPKTIMEKMSPSPKTIMEKMSPSPKTIMEKMSPSPQSFLTSVQTDQSCLKEGIVQVANEDLEERETNDPSSLLPGEENIDSSHKHVMEVTSDQESMTLETGAKEMDEQSLKVHIRIERDTTIRYTPQQLRDLNPFHGLPKLPLGDLWEPKDVLDKMIVLKNPGKFGLNEEEETIEVRNYSKSKLNPMASEFSWRAGCDASSENKTQFGSSVDPSPDSANSNQLRCEKIKNSDKKSSGHLYEEKSNIFMNSGSGLHRIASDLFKSDSGGGTKDVEAGEDWNGGEMWHDDSGDVGEFLKPTKRNQLGKTKKSRKKQGREIPLDQYLEEQEAMKKLSEVDIVDDDDDNFVSPESLKMYVELEQQGVGVANELDGPVPFKFGSHASSSSKRPSLFASVRPEQSLGQRASKPWTPASRRFCTRCGSKDHVVYDCNEMSSRLLQ